MARATRPGEVTAALPPAADAALRFIGRIRSDWGPGDCPRNLRAARESGGGNARVELDPVYAPALMGLAPGQPVIVLYWMDRARRDLLVQSPTHVAGPRGTFSIRSPSRPNPVTLATVRILRIDQATIHIDAIDAFDGTPVIDLKPWSEGIDVPPAVGGPAMRDAQADR
jgi:tRNA-Thr(GGU) m(6)t(6)A37 methyltransferase TsaA